MAKGDHLACNMGTMKQLRGLTRLYEFWEWIERDVGYIDGRLARAASLALPEGTTKPEVAAWCKAANSRFAAEEIEDGRRLTPIKATMGDQEAEVFDAHGIQICLGDVVEVTCSQGGGKILTEQVGMKHPRLPRPFLSIWNGRVNVICLMSVVATAGEQTALLANWVAPDKSSSAKAVVVSEAQLGLGRA